MNDKDFEFLKINKTTNSSKNDTILTHKLNMYFPKIFSIVKIILLALLMFYGSEILTSLIFTLFDENLFVFYGRYISVPILILFIYLNDKNFKICKFNKISFNLGFKSILIGIFILMISLLIGNFFELILNIHSSTLTNSSKIHNFMSHSIWGIIVMAIICPVGEELLCRGFLLNKLKCIVDVRIAIIIQAIFFGYLHGSITKFTFTFISGIIMGYLCYYTNSIVPSLIIHITINTICNIIPNLNDIFKIIALIILIICAFIGSYILWITLKSFKYKEKIFK